MNIGYDYFFFFLLRPRKISALAGRMSTTRNADCLTLTSGFQFSVFMRSSARYGRMFSFKYGFHHDETCEDEVLTSCVSGLPSFQFLETTDTFDAENSLNFPSLPLFFFVLLKLSLKKLDLYRFSREHPVTITKSYAQLA